jgi:hypothetical protein
MLLVIALSFVEPFDPHENSFHAFKIKIHMHTTISPLLFFYSGRLHCTIRASTYLNDRSCALVSLSSNILQKETWLSKKKKTRERDTIRSPHSKKREKKRGKIPMFS